MPDAVDDGFTCCTHHKHLGSERNIDIYCLRIKSRLIGAFDEGATDYAKPPLLGSITTMSTRLPSPAGAIENYDAN